MNFLYVLYFMDPSGELNQNKIPFQKISSTFSKKIVPNPTPTPPHTPHPYEKTFSAPA